MFTKNRVKIFIPARRNSKGLPFKNRILFEYTLKTIPKEYLEISYLSTDDEYLCDHYKNEINIIQRPKNLSRDDTSIKKVLMHFTKRFYANENYDIIMLYLTYPQRKWIDVIAAYEFYKENTAKSLLCRKEINGTHPYLFLLEKNEHRGEQIRKHNLYRRQTYPNVFEISHYISIIKANELKCLNNNLYNQDTKYFKIDDVIDVDSEFDFLNFKKLRNS